MIPRQNVLPVPIDQSQVEPPPPIVLHAQLVTIAVVGQLHPQFVRPVLTVQLALMVKRIVLQEPIIMYRVNPLLQHVNHAQLAITV